MNKVLLDVIINVTKTVTMGMLDIFADKESSPRKNRDDKTEKERRKRGSTTTKLD